MKGMTRDEEAQKRASPSPLPFSVSGPMLQWQVLPLKIRQS